MASATTRNLSSGKKSGIEDVMTQTRTKNLQKKSINTETEMPKQTTIPSDVNDMSTNMTDNIVPTEDENTGLIGQGTGAGAIANGPRGTDYGSMTSGGAMNTINKNIQTPFTMKGNPFSLTEKQENIDVNNDGKISGTDLNELRK